MALTPALHVDLMSPPQRGLSWPLGTHAPPYPTLNTSILLPDGYYSYLLNVKR